MSEKEPIDNLREIIHQSLENLEKMTLDFESTKGIFTTILELSLVIVEEWIEQARWNAKIIKEIEALKKHE